MRRIVLAALVFLALGLVGYALIIGDTNADDKVDILDLVRIASRYDSKEGDARYLPAVDVNADRAINFFDLFFVGMNFGLARQCPNADADPHYDQPGCGTPVDCGVNDAAIYKGAQELCDGKDNDCDGSIDTVDGKVIGRITYTGPPGTEGIGVCQSGIEQCENGEMKKIQALMLPTVEICDSMDNDCDGTADSYTASCYSGPLGTAGIGLCKAGTQSCVQGRMSSCEGEVLPIPELCGDSMDNDCDGLVDQNDQSCASGAGGQFFVGETRTLEIEGQQHVLSILSIAGTDPQTATAAISFDRESLFIQAGQQKFLKTGFVIVANVISPSEQRVDLNIVVTPCVDDDLDSYGIYPSTKCTSPEKDCNDYDAAVHPGAAEVCDGKDNDCDSGVDVDPGGNSRS